MAKFGKWIGAGLGFVLGGPLGALFGLFMGSAFDNAADVVNGGPTPSGSQRSGRGDFMFSLTVLLTAIMKADGKMTRSELDYVKNFLRMNFGDQAAQEALLMIKELRTREIPLTQVCSQIRFNMNLSSRIQLLYYLFGVAQADGNICPQEISLLESIATQMGIDGTNFNSVKSMFYQEADSAYQTLGITPDASDEEIKKAYRKMAMENHPDKVSHLGEDVRKAAEEKFTRINAAYEKIKKQRGIN